MDVGVPLGPVPVADGQLAPRIPWTPRLRAYFLANFVPLTEGPDWLYVRRLSHSP